MAGGLVLYTCELDDGGPNLHPCHKAHNALRDNGHDYETIVFDRNRPLGIGSKGTRPELKRISGQEKLPVLLLANGASVNGGGKIAKWAKQNAAT